MRKAIETASQEASGWKMYVLAAYYLVVGNISLSVAAFGVVLIGVGNVLDVMELGGGNVAIMAGIFGIWGATLVLLGLIGYGLLWANTKYAEFAASQS